MEKISETDGFPIYAKSIMLEHDYSGNFDNNNNNNRDNDSKEENARIKKCHETFDAVDKWADSVNLRVSSNGDDRRKIIEREITILRVKYPFLPEQQIRGKVYEKFGIPAVMGGLLSRGSASSLTAPVSKDRPNSTTTSRSKDPSRRTMESKKTINPQDLSSNNETWHLAEPINQPFYSQTNEERANNQNNNKHQEIYNDAVNLTNNCNQTSHGQVLKAQNWATPPLIKNATITNHLQKEIFTPDVKLSNSPQIVTPLKLDDLTINTNLHLESGNFLKFRNSTGRRNLTHKRVLDFHSKSINRKIHDSTALEEKKSINSQNTQILVKSQTTENSGISRNPFSIVSNRPSTKTQSKSSVKLEIPEDMKIDEIPTQIYVSSSTTKTIDCSIKENLSLENLHITEEPKNKIRKMEENTLFQKKEMELIDALLINDEKQTYEIIDLSPKIVEQLKITIGTSTKKFEIINVDKTLNNDIINVEHSYSGDLTTLPLFSTKESPDFDNNEINEEKNQKNVKNRVKNVNSEYEENLRVCKFDRGILANKENKIISTPSRRDVKNSRKRFNDEKTRNNDEVIDSGLCSSPRRKKRRLYCPITEKISPSRNNEEKINEGILNFSQNPEQHREIEENKFIDDFNVKIVSANFIPLRNDLPLFVVVDPLSNHCWEYDHDLPEITRLCDYANKFVSNEKTGIGESMIKNINLSEFEERIDNILEFLENDCGDA